MAWILSALFLLMWGIEDPATEAREAKEAMAAGNFARAIALYSDLSRSFPQNLDVRKNLGLALHSAGRYEDALRCFQGILSRAPNDRVALLFGGIELTAAHRPAEAISTLTKLLGEDKRNVNALIARGQAYLSIDEFDAATEDFSKATEWDSSSLRALGGLGRAYIGAFQKTFQWIEVNGALSGEWYALLGRSALASGDQKRAFWLLHEAEARSADLPGLHNSIAEVYRSSGHQDWAAVELQHEKQKTGGAESLTPIRRQYLRAIQLQEKSSQVLDKLAKYPDTAEYHSLAGAALRLQGRDTESATEFRRAVQLSPANSVLKIDLSTSLWLAKDCKPAIAILEDVLRGDPSSAEANHIMGECLDTENHPSEAIPFLLAALRSNPKLLPAEAGLGRAYFHLGKYNNAVQHLRRATSLGDPNVLFQLATAYRKIGLGKESTRYLEEYKRVSARARDASLAAATTEITAP
jgi:tetratricopeptide (TPR) repeat protein